MTDAAIAPLLISQPSSGSTVTTERYPVRVVLVATAVVFLVLFLLPSLACSWRRSAQASAPISPPSPSLAVAAIKLTCSLAAIAVPANIVFGLAASWAIAKFEFKGKPEHADRPSLLGIAGDLRPDLCASVRSPGLFRALSPGHNIQIIFALPGIVLATIFVTFPFVARELVPLMQEQGRRTRSRAVAWRERLADLLPGDAPQYRWALLYGVVLCNARAMGEFGAVSVVSGPYQGQDQHHAAACRDSVQ